MRATLGAGLSYSNVSKLGIQPPFVRVTEKLNVDL
jgi:hypothetical protein